MWPGDNFPLWLQFHFNKLSSVDVKIKGDKTCKVFRTLPIQAKHSSEVIVIIVIIIVVGGTITGKSRKETKGE